MAAGAAAGAVFGAAAITRKPAPSGQQSVSERNGNESNANNPANPFGNHAETTIMHNAAPAQQARAPSPGIDASDFPLPGSVAPSERAISLAATPSSDNFSIPPMNHAGQSTLSLAAPSTPASSLGMAAAAAIAGAAASGSTKRDSPPSPPPLDNVYRVQLDFKPSMEDELDIRAGQFVRMVHGYDDGWVCLPCSIACMLNTGILTNFTGALHEDGPLATGCRPAHLPLEEHRQASSKQPTIKSATRSQWSRSSRPG